MCRDCTSTEVANLRAGKLDNGSTPWTNGANHNHRYDVNNAWLRERGDNAHFKVFGNIRQVAFKTNGAAEYAAGVGNHPAAATVERRQVQGRSEATGDTAPAGS